MAGRGGARKGEGQYLGLLFSGEVLSSLADDAREHHGPLGETLEVLVPLLLQETPCHVTSVWYTGRSAKNISKKNIK